MVGWSEALSTHARLAWINCKDIPITCWSQAFFMKLGWQIGEPLLVDDNTENVVHLDKGRVLVLIPHQQPVSAKVKIVGGTRTYVVKVEEDVNPVDIGWIENLLALRKNRVPKDRNSTSAKEDFQICWPTEPASAKVKIVGGTRTYVVKVEEDVNPVDIGWIENLLALRKNRVPKDRNSTSVKEDFQICWPTENGKLNLEKRRGGDRKGDSSSSESNSSSESDVKKMWFLEYDKEIGECSSLKEKGHVAEMIGPLSMRPIKASFKVSAGPNTLKRLRSKEHVDIYVDLGKLVVNPAGRKKPEGRAELKVVVLDEDRSPTTKAEEVSTSGGMISKDEVG
ncbi:hypothetical protein Dsin_000414 [Dipteronia sinensis]|uniref:DUF4283 domain-containing protein n=1 Tax=Dipteronia sinensis TaxID=43782 RepID=A0AAE0EHE2_9ROSI|nr:hypothetical protein Dsin_000414 [Dipteronia sinensis]